MEWGDRSGRSMHVDAQIEQMEIIAGTVQVNSSVDLIGVRKDIRTVAFLESNQRIEGDVFAGGLGAGKHTAGVSGACFQGKAAGGPDGYKVRLKGNFSAFFVAASAFAGESQSNNCKHKGNDERFPHQFPHSYGSWYKHLSTNIVN
jgi:hypothetical protein